MMKTNKTAKKQAINPETGQLTQEAKNAIANHLMSLDNDADIQAFLDGVASIPPGSARDAVQDELQNQLGAFRANLMA